VNRKVFKFILKSLKLDSDFKIIGNEFQNLEYKLKAILDLQNRISLIRWKEQETLSKIKLA